MLEPCEGKLSCTVLRGESGSNTADLLDKPSDIEQREGRGLRHGNQNAEVSVYRYVTKGTFDAYLWGIVETKQRFISQIMTSKELARDCEDVDETVLNFAEIKAVASGNPLVMEKMEVDNEVMRLRVLKSGYESKRYLLQDAFTLEYPKRIENGMAALKRYEQDIQTRNTETEKKPMFEITIRGKVFKKHKEAGEFLRAVIDQTPVKEEVEVGKYNVLVVINPVSTIFSLQTGADQTALTTGVKAVTTVKGLYEAIISKDYSYTPVSGGSNTYEDAANSIGSGLGESATANFMMANKNAEEVELTEANASPADAAQVTVEVERVLSKITFRPNSNDETLGDNIYKVSVPIGTTLDVDVVEGVIKKEDSASYAEGDIVKMNKATDMLNPAVEGRYVYAYYTKASEDAPTVFQGVYGIINEGTDKTTIGEKEYPIFTKLEAKSQADYESATDDQKKGYVVVTDFDGTAGFNNSDIESSLSFIPKEGEGGTTSVDWYVKLEGYALVNLSKNVNYVRHIGTESTATITTTNAFGTLNNSNYLLTPYWSAKNAVTFNNDGTFAGAPATTTWFYNDLAAVSNESKTITPTGGNAATAGTISWEDLTYYKPLPTTDDENQDVTGPGSQHGNPLEGIGKLMDYCFENSTSVDKQVHGLSTGISFLARIYSNKECTTPITALYLYAEHNFTSINDIVEAYSGNVSQAVKDLAAKETGNQPISDEELEAAKITRYRGNVCYYYTTEIKHFDNRIPDESGIMEFAIMRNNIYSLSVSDITQIGEPFVDPTPNVENETKKTYLDIQVMMMPWKVRYNDIEF